MNNPAIADDNIMSAATPIDLYHRGVALIVDDEPTNRLILKSLLSKQGFDILQAENGEQAVDIFRKKSPDIIFMDVMMPVMNGYDATRIIKEESKAHFVPVIFLTAMTDEDALIKCIEAGGDDFLNKPFSKAILGSKITAMERIRSLHRDVSEMYSVIQREQEIAENIFSRAVMADNVAMDKVSSLMKPAGTFSGDMVLSEYGPAGDLYVMLGDFTGHGLAAALGALPASETFRAMCRKGFSPSQILAGINSKLNTMMPTGIFLAVQLVTLSSEADQVTVYNCGMPDILLVDGKTREIKATAPAKNLALGITSKFDQTQENIHYFPFEEGDCLILASDGLSEATNEQGEAFGEERFENIIKDTSREKSIIDTAISELNDFCGDTQPADDISLVEVPVSMSMLKASEKHTSHTTLESSSPNGSIESAGWNVEITLSGKRLNAVNPVPLLINQIQELEGLEAEKQAIFTILTELYVNALDHGVLNLDSSLKATPDGFATYFQERESRLKNLNSGSVSLCLDTEIYSDGGKMTITVKDSGKGFDFVEFATRADSQTLLSGRGIKLMREMADSIDYEGCGNHAIVVYSWVNS